MQLAGILDTGRTASDNNHVHEAVNLLLALAGKRRRLDAVEKLAPNLVGIAQLLEEARVLLDALDAKRLVLAPDGVHEVVVRDRHLAVGRRDLGNILDRDRLGGRVDRLGLGLVHGDLALLVAREEARGLDD